MVLDDQINVASSSKSVADLFIKGAHHQNFTLIYLMQKVYNQNLSQKTISHNSHYRVLFRDGRDASQFPTMAYEICFSNGQWLVDAVKDATSKLYKYLIRDHHPSTPVNQTVDKNILCGTPLSYFIKNYSTY